MAPIPLDTPLPLPTRSHECWFSSITSRTATHFTYTISFRPTRRGCHGTIQIPASRVNADMQAKWASQLRLNKPLIHIERGENTRGLAKFGALIAEDIGADEYVRELQVKFGGETFKGGEVRVPRREFEGQVAEARRERVVREQVVREEGGAVRSIEVKDELPARRTVVFMAAPQRGRKPAMHIWSVDGELREFEEEAVVLGVERPGDGRRHVTIRAKIPETSEWVNLKGDLALDTGHRSGRFEEVGPRSHIK